MSIFYIYNIILLIAISKLKPIEGRNGIRQNYTQTILEEEPELNNIIEGAYSRLNEPGYLSNNKSKQQDALSQKRHVINNRGNVIAHKRGTFEKVENMIGYVYYKVTMFMDQSILILRNIAVITSAFFMIRLGFINIYNYSKKKGSKIRYNEFLLTIIVTLFTDLVCGYALTLNFIYTKMILFIYLINIGLNFSLATSNSNHKDLYIGLLNGSMIFNTIYHSVFQNPKAGKAKAPKDEHKENENGKKNDLTSNVINRFFGSFLF